MHKSGKSLRRRRVITEGFKRQIVSEYEKGEGSVKQLSKFYEISTTCIYNWIHKYSKFHEKSVVVVELKDSQMNKLKKLEARIKELERAVGQKQMNIDYLEKMIELANEEFDIDIKKNSNTPPSAGSRTTKKR